MNEVTLQAYRELLRECFEGIAPGAKGTWFVEKSEGTFDVFSQVDAKEASTKPTSDCNSIASHMIHVLYVLRLANTSSGRPKPVGNWESTWMKQSVTEDEWRQLEANVREEYGHFQDWLASDIDWTEDEQVVGVLTQLPHLAYHLGAMRQLIHVVRRS